MKKLILILLLLFRFSASAYSGEPSVKEIRETMYRAAEYFQSISTHGGYAGIYSPDMKKRYGEALYEPAKETEIWVQPPGTPTIGESFLRAFRLTGDEYYLNAAKNAALALAWGQRKAGGWDHRVDVAHFDPALPNPEKKDGRCAMDDNISQGALTFLMEMDKVIDEEWLDESVELGLKFIMKSQFENGGWPQWYPLIGDYHDYYTFNDNTINDCMRVMLRAHTQYGREEFLLSAQKGGDFIILSQIPSPQSGWAQQYSHDLKPAWARSFEPPGVCSAVTARNIHTLVDLYLYTKNVKYLTPIPAAIEWLMNSKTGDNEWARFYELETNTPVFGDRDGKIHYNYDEISEERKRGYGWKGGFGVNEAIKYYNTVKKIGADAYIAGTSDDNRPGNEAAQAENLIDKVRAIMSSLDNKGRWITEGMLRSNVFVENFNILCSYIELKIKKH